MTRDNNNDPRGETMTTIYIVSWFDADWGGDNASYHTSARKARAEHAELAQRADNENDGISHTLPIMVGTLRKQSRLAQLMDALNGRGCLVVENQRPLD